MNTDERRAMIATSLINRGLGSQQAGAWATQMLLDFEAAGMVLVPREDVALARAVLARTLSAGHNVPGPAHDEVNQAFWKMHAMLAAGGDDADV